MYTSWPDLPAQIVKDHSNIPGIRDLRDLSSSSWVLVFLEGMGRAYCMVYGVLVRRQCFFFYFSKARVCMQHEVEGALAAHGNCRISIID